MKTDLSTMKPLPDDRPHEIRRPQGRDRSGFTLLELLLTFGLTLLLLSMTYIALDTHWRYAVTGRLEMERSQLARGLMRMIEMDLRSLDVRDTTTASPEDVSQGLGLEEAVVVPTRYRFLGTPQQIVLPVRRIWGNRRDRARDPNVNASHSAGDMAVVIYYLQSGARSGLARLAINPKALAASGNWLRQRERVPLLAEEVSEISFSYYDGIRWRDSWDSTLLGRLPRAVEITLRFREPDSSGTLFRTGIGASTDEFRLTLPVPSHPPTAAPEEKP